VSALAVAVSARGVRTQTGARGVIVLLSLLLASKAFMDFSSSGLENPLTHLLLAAFFLRFLSQQRPWQTMSDRESLVLYGLAALGFVNRADTAALFAPACALVLFGQLRSQGRSAWRPLAIGALPALAWLGFSLFYYGSAVPNTAYAKLISVGLTTHERLTMGYGYFANSVAQDWMSLPLCAAAIVLCLGQSLRSRAAAPLMAAAGIAAYLVYVLKDGAAGTHMGGRFFSAPAFLGALSIALTMRSRLGAVLLVALASAVLILSPRSPLRVATPWYDHTTVPGAHVIDTRDYAHREGTSLVDPSGTLREPRHPAIAAGAAFRASRARVAIGGPGAGLSAMVGFSGYASGPDKHIIDVLGLTDPLLARLPIAPGSGYRPGHFSRALPRGYLASVEQRKNKITDADLHTFHERLLQVTRGSLWSLERLHVIWTLNTGGYDDLIRAYAKRNGLRAR
jgi:arabinofuranosyltransferase